jgi:DNA primase
MKTNPKLIDLWTKAAHQYHNSLAGSPAEAYLTQRGIIDGAEKFLLGYVAEVAPGHEDRLRHHLSIPYITEAGVVGFKFRRIDGGDPKYMIPTGQKHHLYNVNAILNAVNQVLVVEGEIDAISATLAGFPAVAVAGVDRVNAVPLIAATVVPVTIPFPETLVPTLISGLAVARVTAALLSVVAAVEVVPPNKPLVNMVAVSPWQISSSCLTYESAGYANFPKSHRSTWLTFLSTIEKQLSTSLRDFLTGTGSHNLAIAELTLL